MKVRNIIYFLRSEQIMPEIAMALSTIVSLNPVLNCNFDRKIRTFILNRISWQKIILFCLVPDA